MPPFKRMKLRYAGACRVCGGALPAGETAVYHRVLKQVECTTCFGDGSATSPLNEVVSTSTGVTSRLGEESLSRNGEPDAMPTASSEQASELDSGTAGASARREHERRVAKREDRIRTRHPRLGGLILAVTDEPQSTRAWERGAVGEEKLARRLDELLARGARVLHDRRIPGTRANIDHIVVGPAGIFVIDAKRYKGRPHLRVEGGIFRPRTEKLMVGSRDCSKLVPGVARQVDLVTAAIQKSDPNSVPVRGMLCFVDADWPLFGGDFTIAAIEVLWPKKIAERVLVSQALTIDQIANLHAMLAAYFPPS